MSAGKGDTPRPLDAKVYGENYDAIFRKEKPETTEPNETTTTDTNNDKRVQ